MEKLYTDKQYTDKAIEANQQGKFLYQYIHEVEYQAEVLEWDYIEVQEERQKIDPETGLPMYDEEGNPIMEIVTVTKAIPKMVEETYIDPETGEEKTRIVQAHHTETFTKEVVELLIDDEFKYVIFDGNFTRCEENPDKEIEKRNKLDKLTLTPADVERALYRAKQMNFDDLQAYIAETMTGIDTKALAIEFKASLFYRGAKFGNGRLFDVVGNMLGYDSDDMDYLFLNKELPVKGDS